LTATPSDGPRSTSASSAGPRRHPGVDVLWRRERLILETDGNQFHHTPRQIARDRRKEADLVRAGYRVLRATWDQVEQEPLSVALMVQAALSAR
jgi:very-short-patch-repair endonuclease